jgi:hypothetical protein
MVSTSLTQGPQYGRRVEHCGSLVDGSLRLESNMMQNKGTVSHLHLFCGKAREFGVHCTVAVYVFCYGCLVGFNTGWLDWELVLWVT